MKTMITMLSFFAAASAFAAPVGGPVTHQFSCKDVAMGVDYSLEVVTMPVNPEYDITAMKLFTRVVAPNAPVREVALQEDSQDFNKAVFSGESFEVRLNKATFEARVYGEKKLLAVCDEIAE
jgi:hypothetical protein